jgi:two-component system, chemotaxis family, protein-glutamate methylesterase/glutaminase
MNPAKVLVVDDSAFMRKIIKDTLNRETDMTVVGTARDGFDALEKIKSLRPNIITLDVEMPKMNGLEALKEIMKKTPTKVIMVSSLTAENAETTIECLALGAVDFIQKPSGSISLDFSKVSRELLQKIRSALNINVSRLVSNSRPVLAERSNKARPSIIKKSLGRNKLLLIASSTGGPRSLESIIPYLPSKIDCPGIIVQHMPAGFTKSLADRLNRSSNITVVEAKDGDIIQDDTIYVAPGNYHLGLKKSSKGVTVFLDSSEKINGVRPAADFTFKMAAEIYGANIVSAVLTGMGKDGAHGVRDIKKKGGIAIAESSSSCVVYGMPKAVVENGDADFILENTEIAEKITELLGE